MEFIISGCIIGLVLGGFLGVIFSVDMQNKIKKIAVIFGCIIIISLIWTAILKSESNSFNNGYCPYCETKYEAIQRKNSQTYYECSNCYYGTWY